MQRLDEYRSAALGYLLTRAKYFTDTVDIFLDAALRSISGLPSRPLADDSYNGLVGKRPVVEQRKLCLKLLLQRLSKTEVIQEADDIVDTAIRSLNSLPARPDGQFAYKGLFKLPPEEVAIQGYGDVKKISISKKGIDLIHKFESYRRCTYKDPGSYDGLPITGGWGSTRLNGKPLTLGKCYSKEVWDNQFAQDLKYFEDHVKKYVKVPITQGMYDALCSWVYNCGVGVLTNSTAIKRLNAKNYSGCAEAMQWWNKGGNGKVLAGLVRRRKDEAELFLS